MASGPVEAMGVLSPTVPCEAPFTYKVMVPVLALYVPTRNAHVPVTAGDAELT